MGISSQLTSDFTDNTFQYNTDLFVTYVNFIVNSVEAIASSKIDQYTFPLMLCSLCK